MSRPAKLSPPSKVSVIIPVYNHAYRLGSAIQSILSQTYQNYEIIVVDDGSTDNLSSVLQPFSNINLLSHTQNLGRAAARNTGVLATSSEYIAFLDADDQWKTTKLAQQIKFLEENKEVAICLTGYEMLMPNGQRQKMPFLKEKEWERYFLKYIALSDGSVPMIRRSCFEKIGLQDTALVWHENWDWLLRATSHSCKVGYIAERLSVKRSSQKRVPAALREAAVVFFVKKHAHLFNKYGLYGRSAISLKWFGLALDFFYEKKPKKESIISLRQCVHGPYSTPAFIYGYWMFF